MGLFQIQILNSAPYPPPLSPLPWCYWWIEGDLVLDFRACWECGLQMRVRRQGWTRAAWSWVYWVYWVYWEPAASDPACPPRDCPACGGSSSPRAPGPT